MNWQPIASLIVGYLIGSIPFGFLIARARGVDIRKVGSGNIGATNVWRMVGKAEGLGALGLDVLKGLVPVLVIAPWLGSEGRDLIAIAAGLGAVLGHAFSVFLKFKGGKAVATSLGVMVSLVPWATLIAIGVFAIVVGASRFISLGSVLAALALVVGEVLTVEAPFDPGGRLALTLFCALVAGLVIVRHRSNIVRLVKGTESRFAFRHKSEKSRGEKT